MNSKRIQFVDNLLHQFRVYEGCKNLIGIVPLTLAGYPLERNFKQDAQLRALLAVWGKMIHSDSVMVLRGDPNKKTEQGYHFEMTVFEPNGKTHGNLKGDFSTMCGNGVRAVAAYAHSVIPELTEVVVDSGAGLLPVKIINDHMFGVDMGELSTRIDDLSRYVYTKNRIKNQNGTFHRAPIPAALYAVLKPFQIEPYWSIGLVGNRRNGIVEGEPHVVFYIKNPGLSLQQLRTIATNVGPFITKNKLFFPHEINANFVVPIDSNREKQLLEVLIVTHERNLGDDSKRSITAACGTGSTVVGSLFLNENQHVKKVIVRNRGGVLEISRNKNRKDHIVMTGPAYEVKGKHL